MDTVTNIEEQVIKVFERDFAISRNSINKDTTLDELKIDKLSTDYVDLLSGLENSFEIQINEDDFLEVIKVGDIVDLVTKYVEIKEKTKELEENNERNNEEEDNNSEDDNSKLTESTFLKEYNPKYDNYDNE